eukprot:70021-Rhodomonas_salina.9
MPCIRRALLRQMQGGSAAKTHRNALRGYATVWRSEIDTSVGGACVSRYARDNRQHMRITIRACQCLRRCAYVNSRRTATKTRMAVDLSCCPLTYLDKHVPDRSVGGA